MGTKTTQQYRAVYGVKKNNFRGVLLLASAVRDGMSGSVATYPDPRPTMTVFGSQVSAYDTAQTAAERRAPLAVPTRDAALEVVWTSLGLFRSYVQSLADASPEQAFILIKGSGFRVGRVGTFAKPILAAKLGVGPGDVVLRGNAALLKGAGVTKGKSATYRWRHSIDGGHTWIEDPPTPLSHTLLHGLPTGVLCLFQACATVSNVVGAWCDAATLMVH